MPEEPTAPSLQAGRYAGIASRYVSRLAFLRSAVRIVHEQTRRGGPPPSA